MTLSDDLSFSQSSAAFDDGSSSYPVAFGVTFTPKVMGVIAGGIGVLGGIYMILNMVMPAWTTFQERQARNKELQADVQQKTLQANQTPKVKSELAESKQLQTQVLGLFANEKSLDTLLLDTSRLVDSSNAQSLGGNTIKAKLTKFAPEGNEPEIITDSSLGSKVDNKLKRQIINVEIEGKFEQMQTIMRNIERLQPLLLVQNYNSQLVEPEINKSDKDAPPVRSEPGKLITAFNLVALMPLSEEEAAKIAAEAAAAKAK
jgi:type IV pilus assembly protein PilO